MILYVKKPIGVGRIFAVYISKGVIKGIKSA